MHAIRAFFLGLGGTAAFAFSVVWYLKFHLRGILIELCGNAVRADFWVAFSNVTLILVPLVFAMQCRPKEGDGVAVFFQLVDQLKWALLGIIATVVTLAIVVGQSILQTGLRAAK